MQNDNNSDDLYNIKNYTDEQLYNILDINHPTDRELEAKIIHLINKYENMQNETGNKMSIFFQNIYHNYIFRVFYFVDLILYNFQDLLYRNLF